MKKLFLFLFSLPIVCFAQVTPNFSYTQTCYGNQTTLVASSSLQDTAISSWWWDLDGNGTYDMSGKTVITLVTINDTVAVKLKITPNVGAADSITKNVIIDPLPQVNFLASNLCESKAAEYVSLSSIMAPGSINQFKWDFNNDGTDDFTGNDTAYFTCGPAQTYITKLTCVSDKGCTAFTQKVTTVYPNPAAAFTTSNACVNAGAMFTNTSTVTNLDFYLWNFGDGNSSSQTNPSHAYSTAGTYTVDLIAVTQAGCRDTATSTIMINPLPAAMITGSNNICAGSSAVLTASGGINYLWNTLATTASITVSPASSVSYSVTATDANGCSNIASSTLIVNPLPMVSITGNDTISAGGSVQLIASGANMYSWSTGETTNAITVTQSGTYAVTGTDLNGCSASDSIRIAGENGDVITTHGFIITPNDDNINDAFIINNISTYQNCDLFVYNQWNDEVFNVKGYKNDWKGTNAGGAPLPAGAYYYIIKCDDKPQAKGNINILR